MFILGGDRDRADPDDDAALFGVLFGCLQDFKNWIAYDRTDQKQGAFDAGDKQ